MCHDSNPILYGNHEMKAAEWLIVNAAAKNLVNISIYNQQPVRCMSIEFYSLWCENYSQSN